MSVYTNMHHDAPSRRGASAKQWRASAVPGLAGAGSIWNVYFGAFKLGRHIERHMRSEDEYGGLKRNNV